MNQEETIENRHAARLRKARNLDNMRKASYATAALSGGAGGVAKRNVLSKTNKAVGRRAYGAAEKFSAGEHGEIKNKLSGIGFWIILFITIADEFVDILLNFTLVFSLFTTLTGILTTFIVWVYLASQGIKFGDRQSANLLISVIIEMIPFVNVIQTHPLMLLVIRWVENSTGVKKAVFMHTNPSS